MENQYFKINKQVFPLTTSTSNTVLRDADPGLWHILRFYVGVLKLHLQPRFNAILSSLNLDQYENKVVAQAIPYDPLPFSTESQYKFPLLAVYRRNESYDWKSISHYQIKSNLDLLYVLPPLSSPTQLKAVQPFLSAAAKVFLDRTMHGSDQNLENQKHYWQDAGIQSIHFASSEYGTIPGSDSKIVFPTLHSTIQLEERHLFTSEPGFNFEELVSISLSLDLRDGYEDGYQDFPIIDGEDLTF